MQSYFFSLFTFHFLLRPRRGQSLVEAVVAVAVVLLLVTGLIVATTSSVKFSTLSSYRTQATQIAKEVMEAVRDLRDSSWTDFITKSISGVETTYCLSGSYEWTILPDGEECAGDTGDFYIRTVKFDLETPDAGKPDQKRMKVTVTIGWAEGTSKKSATLVTYFTNWRTE